MPKNVNIFFSVIDNLGDIGFACEIVRTFHQASPGKYFFDIWTDTVDAVESFFSKNEEIRGKYSIQPISAVSSKKASLSFLLFHTPIPERYPYEEEELFLRIDYLSLDREWLKHHGTEHIDSRPGRKIIEIIPSPLEQGGGIIFPEKEGHTRTELADRYGLDPRKEWKSVFSYQHTLEQHLTIEPLNNSQVLMLGNNSLTSVRSPDTDKNDILYLPFLSLKEFSSIIKESQWAIIRGEVSCITTLTLGTPLFWDTYKQIGGYNASQANDFLDWYGGDDLYRKIFHRLNGQNGRTVELHEIDDYFSHHKIEKKGPFHNLREELEKYIDKYHISL